MEQQLVSFSIRILGLILKHPAAESMYKCPPRSRAAARPFFPFVGGNALASLSDPLIRAINITITVSAPFRAQREKIGAVTNSFR